MEDEKRLRDQLTSMGFSDAEAERIAVSVGKAVEDLVFAFVGAERSGETLRLLLWDLVQDYLYGLSGEDWVTVDGGWKRVEGT